MLKTRLFRFFGYTLSHAAICWGLSVLAAILLIQLESAMKEPGYANEFAGIPFVLAFYFSGPISAACSLPAHGYLYLKQHGIRAHFYSLAASATAVIGTWAFLYL